MDTSTDTYAAFLEWHSHKVLRRTGAAPRTSTLETKRYRVQAIANQLGCEAPMSLAAVVGDREQVEALFDKLYLTHAPSTIASTARALRAFGEYAVAQGWIDRCEVTKSDAPTRTPRRKPVEVYSAKEVERVLLYSRVKSLRFWCLLTVLEQTGMRISEALNLMWTEVLLDADPPHIALPRTKTRQAMVPLTTKLREEVFTPEHIVRLKSQRHPLWSKDPVVYVFPGTYRGWKAQYAGLCEAAEVPWRNGFHVWRHTFAVRRLTEGVPMHIVSRWLNHSSVAITDKYYAHTTALSFQDWVE